MKGLRQMRTVKNLDVLSKGFNAVKKTEGGKKRKDDAEKMKRCEKYHFETEKGVRQKKYKFAAGKSCSLCTKSSSVIALFSMPRTSTLSPWELRGRG